MAETKWDRIASTYSIGGDTAEIIYSTAVLYVCKSELSFSSDMRRISGLGEAFSRRSDQRVQHTYSIGTVYGNIMET
jgi:hypothetical protein